MPSLDQLAPKASQNLATFADTVDRHRNDPRISDEGRRELIAKAYIRALDKARELKASVGNDNAAEQRRLEDELLKPHRPLGATPSDRVAIDSSYRDALQRAHQTKDGTSELADLYELARRVDDELLAKAALTTAIDRPDVSILQGLHDTDPTLASKVGRLFDLRSGAHDLKFALHLEMTIPDPSLPPELGNLGETQIRALAGVIA